MHAQTQHGEGKPVLPHYGRVEATPAPPTQPLNEPCNQVNQHLSFKGPTVGAKISSASALHPDVAATCHLRTA